VARDPRLLAGLALVLLLAGASPALARTQTCTVGPLIEHWDGISFSQVPLAGEGQLSAVAAVSAGDVWAFGTQPVNDVVIDQAFAEHWNGLAWERVPIRRPKGAEETYLVDAAVVSSTDIWAVGSWAGAGPRGYRTLVEHWNGTAWKIVRSPNPTLGCSLSGVTAVSSTNAWAVGECAVLESSQRFKPVRTLVLHWNGTAWRKVPSPQPSAANARSSRHDSSLADVDAVSARNIWAVGTYFRRARNGHHAYQTLVLHWNGRAWRKMPSPNPGGNRHPNTLEAVAARSSGEVWATGSYRSTSGRGRLLAAHGRGGSLRAVPMPPLRTPHSPQPGLTSLSPLAADDVWATGWYLDDDGLVDQRLVAHWNGRAWGLLPTPQIGTNNWLSGIAAVSSSDVWAVGGWDSCS
jgi:hypothetical protein